MLGVISLRSTYDIEPDTQIPLTDTTFNSNMPDMDCRRASTSSDCISPNTPSLISHSDARASYGQSTCSRANTCPSHSGGPRESELPVASKTIAGVTAGQQGMIIKVSDETDY